MSPDLDRALCNAYPSLFRYRHSKASRRPIAFYGLECGDGWYDLLATLCDGLMGKAGEGKVPAILQVKEKFGQLRVYAVALTDEQGALIDAAEAESARICEHCGSPAVLRTDGWMRTRCDRHSRL
jgi:hypothetical protein